MFVFSVNTFETMIMDSLEYRSWNKNMPYWLLWPKRTEGRALKGLGRVGQHPVEGPLQRRIMGGRGFGHLGHCRISWKTEFANQSCESHFSACPPPCFWFSPSLLATAGTQRPPHTLPGNKGRHILSKWEVTAVKNMPLPNFPCWEETLAPQVCGVSGGGSLLHVVSAEPVHEPR